MNAFNDRARYHDPPCRDQDYTGEARFIQTLLRKYAPNARSILELDCGTGYRAVLLAGSEYGKIHGIDRDRQKIERARERLIGLPAEIAVKLRFDRADSALLDREFDAAISLFQAEKYSIKMIDLQAAFTTAKNHLKADGTFVLDCWYGPPVLSDLPAVRVKRLKIDGILDTLTAESEDSTERGFSQYQIDNALEELQRINPTRYCFQQEIEYLFARSGLRLIERFVWMNEKIAGFDTWGIYFIGKR